MSLTRRVDKLEAISDPDQKVYNVRLDWGIYHIEGSDKALNEGEFRDWLLHLKSGIGVIIIYRGDPPPLMGRNVMIADTDPGGVHLISIPDNERENNSRE